MKWINLDLSFNGLVFDNHFIAIEELYKIARDGEGSTTLFTCDCGHAGCAGYFDEIIFKDYGSHIIGIFEEDDEPKLKQMLGVSKIYINRQELLSNIEQLFSEAEQLAKVGIYPVFRYNVCNEYEDYDREQLGVNYGKVIRQWEEERNGSPKPR